MPDTVTVSGVGVPDFAIAFPSGQLITGQPGSNLYAFMSSMNSTFGFNDSPSRLDMEFVPVPRNEVIYHGASGQLPGIGNFMEMFIGDFYFRGRIVHSDYNSTDRGTIISVSLEDDRKSLDKIRISTEDLGEDIPSGVVSVARTYRLVHGLTDDDDEVVDALVFEYNKIRNQGATYGQILEALQLAIDEETIDFAISKLPSIDQVEANIGGAVESLRFKFNATKLTDVITAVLQDSAYDWYWNSNLGSVALVNKKTSFTIEESNLIALINEVSGYGDVTEGTKGLTFGQDVVSEPTKVRLLGGRQQGFMNSALLSPIDGLETTAFDSNLTFTPAWSGISVGFYDADGYYRTYTPTSKELQMSLAGIEQWTYFKIYQVSQFNIAADAGSIAAKHETFESRFDPLETLADLTEDPENDLRIISNRRDEEQNWVLDFYNRVHNHAQRHFGRSYVVENIIFNETSGLFQPVDAAWCNIENQIEGQATGVSGSPGPFVDGYTINSTYGPISPFVTDDFRVAAHVVLPANTVYGPQGDQAPASFANWTEDAPPFNPTGDGKHYVPCTISIVGKRTKNPRSDELYSFEDYPDGTLWVQLPIIAGTMAQDATLANLATLIELSKKIDSKGLFEIVDPTQLIQPYDTLTGVAVPVEARIRYGQSFPNPWVTGDEHYQRGQEVIIDDAFVPWNFFPIGNDTSLEIMNDRAVRKMVGRVVDHVFSRYADINQVGLPTVSYNSFADQSINASGLYGERSHGVTDLNVTLASDGYMTRYKIASYFGSFGREAPLGEKLRAELDGILHPIDFTDFNLVNAIPAAPGEVVPGGNAFYPSYNFGSKKAAVRVTISEINDVFTIAYAGNPSSGPTQERYRGITLTGGYEKPPTYTGHDDFVKGAVCVDGFLNIDDEALYHVDEFEQGGGNTVYRYFTGGRPFGNSSIVTVQQVNASDSTKYDVTLDGGGLGRAILGVPVLGGGAFSATEQTILCLEDNATVKPGNANAGLYLYKADTGGIPVEIISLTNAGQNVAEAVVRRLKATYDAGVFQSLDPDTTKNLVSGVIPFPFPDYAQVGDQGLLGETSNGYSIIYIGRLPFRSV